VLFSSYEFIFGFLPITLLAFHLARKYLDGRIALGIIVASSLFFYGWWNPLYLLLLTGSMVVNYAFARRLEKRSSAALLFTGVTINLAVLGYFKYRNFFLENVSHFTGHNWELEPIFVPLAISFFTFQQIAFLVDVREGRAEVRDFVNYSAFVALFPQLIAGPIVLYREIDEQFDMLRSGKGRGLALFGPGLLIFALGLFKKVALADAIAPYADTAFNLADRLTFLEAWAGAIAYSLQLYFDFSGYADMAVGLGLMLGIILPINFNTPFRATSMVEFWKRWHITMTRFFMMYLYSPIALSITRQVMERGYSGIPAFTLAIAVPIGLTFLLSGLWHGAAWTFVAFGAVNAVGLITNHAWRQAKLPPLPSLVGWLLTMTTVVISFVYFRAESIENAHAILLAMATPQDIILPNWLAGFAVHFDLPWRTLDFFSTGTYTLRLIVWIGLLFIISVLPLNRTTAPNLIASSWSHAFLTAALLLISFGLLDRPQAFIYFQF
jgi:alginate O-acetyltransferase complex protein AlgI